MCVLHFAIPHAFPLNVEQEEIERSNDHEAHLTEAQIHVPFPPEDVASPEVLDLGSGTGIWCSKVLNDHENGDCEACVTHVIPEYLTAIPTSC